jgi:hypothetical protein
MTAAFLQGFESADNKNDVAQRSPPAPYLDVPTMLVLRETRVSRPHAKNCAFKVTSVSPSAEAGSIAPGFSN